MADVDLLQMLDVQGDELKCIELKNSFIQKNTIYVKPGVYSLSKKKIDGLKRIADLQKYYQCNPVRFISDFFGYTLFDAQTYMVMMSWTCPNVLVLCTRSWGKSTVGGLIIMAKSMLYNSSWTYIASGSGSQAQQTFTTLERLANDAIDTFVGSSGYIFKQELEIPNAIGDGFSHSADGWRFNLYNGSFCQTLNSNVDKKRGSRGSVLFDETGWLSEEMLQTYAAFAVTNKKFKTGKDRDGNDLDAMRIMSMPEALPFQKFYLSSASSTDTEFYKIFRLFSKKMLIGDPDYFVACFDCETAFHPTLKGKPLPSLLDKSTVENAMKTNPDKARREYYCQFTTDAGANAIIRRGSITRNSEIRRPVLYNDTGSRRFALCFDPARRRDQSVIMVVEIYEKNKQIEGRLVNCVNLIDIQKKKKTPMTLQKQVDVLRELIVDYNQGGDEFYSNIIGIYIDAGPGGQPDAIAEELMKDWTDRNGVFHKGLIDRAFYEEDGRDYLGAVNKVKMCQPSVMKAEFYESLIQMVEDNHLKFTSDYDSKGYLMIPENEAEYAKKKEQIYKKLEKEGYTGESLAVKAEEELPQLEMKQVRLDWKEEAALAGIDLAKEQVVNMVRIPRQGSRDSFELTPEKRNTSHDDHAYATAMCAWVLKEERRKANKPKKKQVEDVAKFFSSQTKKATRNIHMMQRRR